jgi:predicted metal-dependent peptidase
MSNHFDNLGPDKIHEKIVTGLTTMLFQFADVRFYAEFLMFVNFNRGDQYHTMAVTVEGGSPKLYWAHKFVDSLEVPEINFVLIHECIHLLSNHCERASRMSHMIPDFSHKLSNFAQDMIINHLIVDAKMPEKIVTMPKERDKDGKIKPDSIMGMTLPPEYKGTLVWEELYLWLTEQKKKYEDWKKDQPKQDGPKMPSSGQPGEGEGEGDGQEEGEGEGKEKEEKKDGKGKCPVSKQLKQIFENLEDYQFDFHGLLKDIPEDLREAVVKDIVQGLRNRGLVPANIESMLEKINPTKKDYLKDILSGLAFVKGRNQFDTFKRMNRRGVEGLKGYEKIGAELCVVLDVSGSMSGLIEKVLSVIYRDGIVTHVAQCDTEVHKIIKATKRSDIQKMKITGYGGTILQPAIDMFKNDPKYKKMNLVVLTDGCCDTLNLDGFKKVLLVTGAEKVPVGKKPLHLRQVKVDSKI